MYLNKMIYQVWEELEGLHITDDTKFTYEFIKDKIIIWNQTLMNEAFNARLLLDGFYQIINGNVVESVEDSQTIGGVTFSADAGYYKTVPPKLVNTVGWNEIIYFGTGDLKKSFLRRSVQAMMHQEHARFSLDMPVYARAGDTIVMKSIPTSGFTFATLVAISIDPTTISGWSATDEDDFPTPSPAKLMMLVKKDIISSVGRPDIINDAQDKINVQQPQQENRQ